MKRMKGVEDLNTIRAQGIMGVGAIIRTPTSSYRAVASRPTASTGLPADRASSCPSRCSQPCFVACSWRD